MKKIFITIYILFIMAFCGIIFGVPVIMEKLYKEALVKQGREEVKGLFSLVMERLEGLEPDDQQREIELLQPRFGFMVAIKILDETKVDEEYMEEFKNGVIVPAGEDQNMAAQRIGHSGMALYMDPYSKNNETFENKLNRIFIIVCCLLMALPALIWSFILQKDLKKIGKATAAFGKGDHLSRVKISSLSTMAFIGDAFNGMAQRTENLILSQQDLANSVSHEIRTPLSRIKFSLEMMAGPTPSKRDYITESNKDVEEIETLVDEMLTYARFNREPAKKGELPIQDILSWLSTVINLEKRNMAQGKTLEFVLYPGNERILTQFHPRYLEWVIRNLVRNAIRHAAGRIKILVEEKERNLAIHVDDDGPGIPEEKHKSVFKPFVRLDQSRNRESGGYGLGLAIAQRITLWHRGQILICRSPMNGARFTLLLPLSTPS